MRYRWCHTYVMFQFHTVKMNISDSICGFWMHCSSATFPNIMKKCCKDKRTLNDETSSFLYLCYLNINKAVKSYCKLKVHFKPMQKKKLNSNQRRINIILTCWISPMSSIDEPTTSFWNILGKNLWHSWHFCSKKS